jgi:hypothetical protein
MIHPIVVLGYGSRSGRVVEKIGSSLAILLSIPASKSL